MISIPIYDYECTRCKFQEINRKAHPDDEILTCPKCKGNMKRLLHAQFGINMGVGAYGYYDDNLETYVNTNKERREVMREKGVTEKGETPKDGDSWV